MLVKLPKKREKKTPISHIKLKEAEANILKIKTIVENLLIIMANQGDPCEHF